MKLSNKELENISTTAINRLCMETRRIDAYIEKNDKTPSWDGELFFYNERDYNKDLKKSQLIKKIPIQIKATQVKEFTEKGRNFSMDVSDLYNYYKNEGVILFLVEVKDFDKYKIFYSDLLHSKLKDILNEVEEKKKKRKIKNTYNRIPQSSKSIFVEELNTDKDFFISLLNYYVENSDMQSAVLTELDYKEDNTSGDLIMNFKPSKEKDKFVDRPFTLYKKELIANRNKEIAIPVAGEFKMHGILRNYDENVTVGDKVFYRNYKISFWENNTIYHLNDYLYIHKEEGKFYTSTPSGTIDEYIYNLEFQLELFDKQCVKLGEKVISFNVDNSNQEKAKLLTQIDELKKLKNTLNILKLKQSDFQLEFLKEDDSYSIGYLIASFYTKDAIPNKHLTSFRLCTVQVANHELLFEERYDDQDSYLVDILGNPHENMKEIDSIVCSPYLLLTVQDLNYFNYNLDIAASSIMTGDVTYDYISLVLKYIYQLIEFHDLVGSEKHLQCALKLLDWLFESVQGHTLRALKYSIIKRIRPFNNKELIDIYKLKDIENVNWFHFTIYVLLDNFEEQNNIFKELSDVDLKILKYMHIDQLANISW